MYIVPLLFTCCTALPCRFHQHTADCSHSKLHKIPTDLPGGKMTSLLLSHNRLLQLPPESFQNYSLIEHLDVSYNSISKVKPGVCAELAKLSWLSLEHNEVKDISSAFIRCNNMSALFLGHNRLDVDPTSNPFFLLKFLAVLDVSENGLKSAQLGVLPQLKHLRNLSVSHNSIKVFVVSTLVVTAFIVLGLLFHLEGWRLEYWATVLSHRMLGCDQLMPGKSVAEQNEPALRYNYDAFVVNAQKDGRWIAHNVEPLEEGGGLRLYFEGRDQVGGDFRLEAIAQAMRESRRILVVVTRSLFKDAWCRNFTVLQALHRAIEQSREAVILVFLEDIPDHELHVNLNIRAAMFPRRCILHWPQDLNQLPLFHRRLRAALGYTL
uniref:toll-like receptor 3 n=1 Tax=Myxine glutinosa TaxID=7769 RepID=UPI00358F09E1